MRKCLDFLKASGRRSIPTEDVYFSSIPDKKTSPEEAFLLQDSQTQVEFLCSQLKSPYREVANAHFCRDLSPSEIAAMENKPTKTIQTQLYRAKGMLKKMLERSD